MTFLAINNDNQLIGYLCFSLRNKHLKISYLFYHQENKNEIAKSIESLIIKKNPLYITLFLPQEIIDLLHFKHLFKKKIYRYFKISTTLYKQINTIENITIYDGDGDAVFT